MDRNIKSSQLKVIRGAGHDLPLRKPKIVGNEIDKFINDR